MPVDLSSGLVRPDRLAARLDDPSVVVLDASFTLPAIHPTGAEPYRKSHIPGSRNLPVGTLADAATGRLSPQDALRGRFAAAGVDPDRPGPITTTCGSGVTAAALAFGPWQLGRKTVAVSDGSRSEWGSAGLPMARGPAEVPA